MSKRTCAQRGCNSFVGVVVGRGRPRKFCDEHRRVDARYRYAKKTEYGLRSCRGCRESFTPNHGSQKWCSPRCLDRHGGPKCGVCGLGTARGGGRRAADGEAVHRDCLSEHGSYSGLRRGCNCGDCRAFRAKTMWEYGARRRAEGRPLKYDRPTVQVSCNCCGKSVAKQTFRLRIYHTSYCSHECLMFDRHRIDITDPDYKPRDRGWYASKSLRLAVLDRDNFVCWLCGDLTNPKDDPGSRWYPTLDHVVPRSRGGGDDPDNLRCAHRVCNSRRGTQEVISEDSLRNSQMALWRS